VASLLPLLATLRRQVGLPHRIVLDEAHYFLGEQPTSLLDQELAGYTLATYRLSQLPRCVLAASEAIIVTRMTEPREIAAVLERNGAGQQAADWAHALGALSVGEAVLLPGIEEARGRLRRFRLAPRLTSHVRHRQKYVDVPVAAAHAFVFTEGGEPTGARARTLRELSSTLEQCSSVTIRGHLERGDVSHWVGEVFGDDVLAARLRDVERLDSDQGAVDARDAIRTLIDERYAVS
jgi:hypothetical protein